MTSEKEVVDIYKGAPPTVPKKENTIKRNESFRRENVKLKEKIKGLEADLDKKIEKISGLERTIRDKDAEIKKREDEQIKTAKAYTAIFNARKTLPVAEDLYTCMIDFVVGICKIFEDTINLDLITDGLAFEIAYQLLMERIDWIIKVFQRATEEEGLKNG